MIILGLGSNVGDRLQNLRNAYQRLQQLSDLTIQQVSPVYTSDALLPENAPQNWNMPYFNLALRCETTLEPLALLDQIKNIEWTLGRKPEIRHWGPRVIDIDILAWDENIIHNERLNIPHANLQERPFALWPLADVAPLWKFPLQGKNHGKTAAQMVEPWRSRFTGEAPFHTRQILQRIDTSQFVGIINVTPDSYSDGGLYLQADAAVKQMLHLVASGAEIIDIGAESTSPQAKAITPHEEWLRLEPVLSAVQSAKHSGLLIPKICVDTRHASVAKNAIAMGVDWLNDVSGLDDADMREIVRAAKTDCVIMHHLQLPEDRNHVLPRDQDPVKFVYAWAEKRIAELEKDGIARERLIFDPGIGFGKMAEQSLLIIKNISVFHELGVRLFVGHSRKTFMSLFTALPFVERDAETMAMTIFLAQQKVDYIRVHNVEICARGMKVAKVI